MAIRTMTMPVTYIEAAAVFIAGITLKILPLPLAVVAGTFVARLIGLLSHRSIGFVVGQMRATFGSRYSDAQYRKMAHDFFRHMGCMLAESVRLKSLTKENIYDYVDFGDGLERVRQIVANSGCGVFMTTGHIGNWEIIGAAGALTGVISGSIARPLDNPLVNDMITSYREHSGQKIWSKRGAVTNILRAIKKGESIGILIDQDAGPEGISVPFLGRPASTVTTIADLSIRTGAPLVPVAVQRVGGQPMKFHLNVGEVVYPDQAAEPEGERVRILTRLNEELSRMIEAEPVQWLWTHRRWKTPNARGKKAAQ